MTEIDRSWILIVPLNQYEYVIRVTETSLDQGFRMVGSGNQLDIKDSATFHS